MALSEAWLFGFKFYEEKGLPKFKPTEQFQKNYNNLLCELKFKLNRNILAFLVHGIFLCLDLWRKAISMTFCLIVLYFIITMFIPFKPSTGISVGDISARMFFGFLFNFLIMYIK